VKVVVFPRVSAVRILRFRFALSLASSSTLLLPRFTFNAFSLSLFLFRLILQRISYRLSFIAATAFSSNIRLMGDNANKGGIKAFSARKQQGFTAGERIRCGDSDSGVLLVKSGGLRNWRNGPA
jgi:hypothetical protein